MLLSVAGQEARYIVETGDRQFIQINETPVTSQEDTTEQVDTDDAKKEENNFWDRNKIKLLLTLCLENNFRNHIKDKALLDGIAEHVGTSPDECATKYKNLRRTFIRLLKKKRVGKEIKWVHFNICEKVFNECKSLPSSILEPWDDHRVRNLLNLYIENLSRFRSSDCLQKDVWRDIASQLATTEYNCYHKYKNLKRAHFKWMQRSRDTGKPAKWPYHQYFERIYYEYNPNTGPWDRVKTKQLMDAYLQIADKFKSPRYQKKDLWKEISIVVGESAAICDKKFRNMKQTYLKLKSRAIAGRAITKWRYYKDFENIYNSANRWEYVNTRTHDVDYVKQLLNFYLENKEKFRDQRIKKKTVWKLLSPEIGLSPEECDRKFRNLKQTYIRLEEKRNLTGRTSSWPYYEYFKRIFDEPKPSRKSTSRVSLDKVNICDLQRVGQKAHCKQDDDNFDRLIAAMDEANDIQRQRNKILERLLHRK